MYAAGTKFNQNPFIKFRDDVQGPKWKQGRAQEHSYAVTVCLLEVTHKSVTFGLL